MKHRTHAQHLASKLNLRPRPILVRQPQQPERVQLTPHTNTNTSPLLVNTVNRGQ